MMNIAAVPRYIGSAASDFSTVPPGHRFSLYLPVWDGRSWGLSKTGKGEALKKSLGFPLESREQIDALRTRQQQLLAGIPENEVLSLETIAIAPLVTGMGMEHPLENGFAFLNPYGIPYLPGSSIKGVLRRAAEELIKEDSCWSQEVIDKLYGPEGSENAYRGVLTFWDSIPEIKGNSLAMDVMTPHYGDYYQGKTSPHDAGQPNPIVFMVIPPESRFSLHISAEERRLPESLQQGKWKGFLEAAFQHASNWLGFGAKTAVGYGVLERDLQEEARKKDENTEAASKRAEEAESRKKLASLSPLERQIKQICKSAAGGNPGTVLLKLLDEGEWCSTEDKRIVAEKIKTLWGREGTWIPEFGGTNKKKVKLKQRCLEVQEYLG